MAMDDSVRIFIEVKLTRGLDHCPFCAGEATMCVFEDEDAPPELDAIYLVRCNDCDAQGPHRSDPFSAQKWWNCELRQVAIDERDTDRAYTEKVRQRKEKGD